MSCITAEMNRQLFTYATADCSLGMVLMAMSGRGVCSIILGDDAADIVGVMQRRLPGSHSISTGADGEKFLKKIVTLIENPTLPHDLPLDIQGTAFQRRVWHALCEIPPGTTLSYSQVAKKIGHPTAVRAIAGACAANQLAVVIPCHRVIREDGQLSGYRWGTGRKRALLAREAK
jgi:O-6-methylguanine DNA methyltransferase